MMVLLLGLMLGLAGHLAPAGAASMPGDARAAALPDGVAPPGMVADPLQPLDTSSPSATYQSFLIEMRRVEVQFLAYSRHKTLAGEEALIGTVADARSLFDLAPLAPALRDKMGGAAIMYLADILNRLPPIPAAAIPGGAGEAAAKLPAQWRLPGTSITIARIDKGPEAGKYLFTADTVLALPRDHALIIHNPPLRAVRVANWRRAQVNLTGPLVPDRLVRSLPDWALRTMLGTPAWKVIASVLFILLVFALGISWGGVAERRRQRDTAAHLGRAAWALSRPVVFFLLYVVMLVFIRSQLNLSGAFAAVEAFFSTVILYLTLAWMAWTGCFFLAETIIASPRFPDDSFDSHLLRLTARLLGFAGAVTLLLYGANALGIPALGLVAGLGVGGIAVALASQSTVENLIGGFSIFADRPFRVGDSILVGTAVCQVESIGPRSSRLRAQDGTLTTVPNSDLSKMHVTNYSMRNRCLFRHQINLPRDTTPERCAELIEQIRGMLRAHPLIESGSGKPRVVLSGLSDSALTIEIEAAFLMTDWAAFLEVQQDLLLGILRLTTPDPPALE